MCFAGPVQGLKIMKEVKTNYERGTRREKTRYKVKEAKTMEDSNKSLDSGLGLTCERLRIKTVSKHHLNT